MSARTRTLRKFTPLAIPALALISFAGCSSEQPGFGFGGSGGGIQGTGSTTASGGGSGFSSGGGNGLPSGGGSGLPSGGGSGVPSGGSSGNSGGNTGAGGGNTTGSGGGPTDPIDCVLPDLPPIQDLPRNEKLPDPFTFFDGTPVTTKAQWECRRREIQHMAATYIYGPYPFEPDETTGTVNGNNISITCKEGNNTEELTASLQGNGSIITYSFSGGILPPNGKALSFGAGYGDKIRNLFGLSENMNPNVAVGWMIDRVIEVLEQNPDSGHDPTKMAVSGCSGCGKATMLAGVFSRIPMTIIVESGGGGASNLRQTEWFRHGAGQSVWNCPDGPPQGIDNLENSGACTPWVGNVAQPIRNNSDLVYNLPFDQHLLLATIAPRYLVHFTNNNGTGWCHLGGTGEALSAWAAAPVFNALGVPDNIAFEMYNGGHCGVGDTGIAADMYERAFNGNTTIDSGKMIIPNGGVQQPVSEWESMWIDWDMNTVLQ